MVKVSEMHLVYWLLGVALPALVTAQKCTRLPETTPLPAGYTRQNFTETTYGSGAGAVTQLECNSNYVLGKFDVGGPLGVIEGGYPCNKTIIRPAGSNTILPIEATCINEAVSAMCITYYVNAPGGSVMFATIQPNNLVCPSTYATQLSDGTPITSFTCTGNPGSATYSIKLANGTIKTQTTEPKFKCLAPPTTTTMATTTTAAPKCTRLPESTPLPTGYTRMDLTETTYGSGTGAVTELECASNYIFGRFDVGGPLGVIQSGYPCNKTKIQPASGNTILPIEMTCVNQAVADMCIVYYTNKVGYAMFATLKPDNLVCPPGTLTQLNDGTTIKSFTCTGFPPSATYTIALANGTVITKNDEPFIKCTVPITTTTPTTTTTTTAAPVCTHLPESSPLPAGFTRKDWTERNYGSVADPELQCDSNAVLARFDADGPFGIVQYIYQCDVPNHTLKPADPSTILPIEMTCVNQAMPDICVVYYVNDVGFADFGTLKPNNLVCPPNFVTQLIDGTPIKSFTCTGFPPSASYNIELWNGTTVTQTAEPHIKCIACQTSWSDWSEWTSTCLATGGQTRNRTCNGAVNGCKCTGSETESQSCCCPTGGVWSEWAPTSGTCPTTCGSCTSVALTRTCLSQQYGCACSGATTSTGPCGTTPCPSGTVCCTGYSVMTNPNTGASLCGNAAIPLSSCCNSSNMGTWGTEWSEWTGDCTISPCGKCDKQTRTLSCTRDPTLGCPCSADPTEGTETQGCGNDKLCTLPKKTCCAPYIKRLVGASLVCA